MNNSEIEKHIAHKRNVSPLMSYLREIVYGGLDGIVTTFAIVAGFTGANLGADTAQYSFLTVLLFGLANLVADSTSMGLGNFLSIRAEKDVYRKRMEDEKLKMKNDPDQEANVTKYLLKEKGFDDDHSKQLVSIYKNNPKYWLEWMMQHELEVADVKDVKAFRTGLATFFSFLVFGFLPLFPFIVFRNTLQTAFIVSVIFTIIAFFLLGILRHRVIGDNIKRSLLEVMGTGVVAASLAFIVGMIFRGL